MNTLTVLPFLLAMFAAVAAMPTNVYQICAWNAGTLHVEPWRRRTAAALRSATQGLRAWLASLWSPRLAFACLAVLLALLLVHQGVGHDGVLLAIAPAAVPLVSKRATILREAEGLRGQDGTFKDDAVRAAVDAKMAEIEALDVQIRKAEADAAQPPTGADVAVRAAGVQAERDRITGIQSAVRTAKLDEAFAADLVARNVTLDQARSDIFAKMAAASDATRISPYIEVGADPRDKWIRGASNWLLVKSGTAGLVARSEKTTVDTIDPGEFRGMTQVELARMVLERAGVKTSGMDKMAIVGKAFATRANITQTTSDLAVLFEVTVNKVLRASFATAPDTWRLFAAESTNPDFRSSARYRMGSFGILDTVTEAGEFKNKAIPDGEKQSLTVATKGNIINWSRQMAINDDLGALSRMATMLGRAAKLSVEVDMYALLAQNAGLGPTLADGLTLFHATHLNISAGSALSVDALDADRVVLAQQKDVSGNEYLDVRPDVLLLPLGLGGQARVFNDSQFDASVSNKFQVPNKVRGLFRTIVDSPRISGTRRYLFADPQIAPVLEAVFLEGQTEPTIETQEGFRVDGTEMKVRYDYGVGAVDYRGAVTNAGV